jgi:glutaredoxin
MAERTVLYTLRNCPTCDKARSGLTERGVDFEERMVDDSPAWYEEATRLSATVPIIVTGDRVEVGWDGDSG